MSFGDYVRGQGKVMFQEKFKEKYWSFGQPTKVNEWMDGILP